MIRWASLGVARVQHVLTDSGRRALTLEELALRHPRLVGRGETRDRVSRMYSQVLKNLKRWEHVLAAGPQALVQAGQFRHNATGQLLRAVQAASPGDHTVPACVCEIEAQSGHIRVTAQAATLPAAAADSELRPTIRLWHADDGDADTESNDGDVTGVAGQGGEADQQAPDFNTPKAVQYSKGKAFRHAALGPRGAPPTPDPRLLEWVTPATSKAETTVCLAYATTKQVRQTYLARDWVEPRSLTQRYAPALAGLTAAQRWRLLSRLAIGISHPAIPEAERHHLWVTIHHGHRQGANKCKGDKALCARCLQRGDRHEETATHEVAECPEARAVWAGIAKAWEAATGEPLDTTTPRLTVMGLRPEPGPSATKQARDRHAASEPAWRLLHAVTLLQLHQARTRVHMAHHAQGGPHEAKRATPRHILRAVRQRVAGQVRYEHDRAKHAMRGQPKPAPGKGAWARFHGHWIASGIASLGKEGPRLNLLSAAPHTQPVAPGSTHIRVTAALLPAKAGQPPKAGWALAVEDVAADGTRTTRMSASGAIATAATHGARHSECVADRQTWQVACQVAVRKGLLSAAQQRRRRRPLTLTVHSVTTARDLVPPRKGETRPRTSHRRLASNNIQTLGRLNAGRDASVVVRVDTDLPPEGLRQAAEHAAHSGDLRSRHPAGLAAHARSPWDELRVWDPGD